MIKYWNNERAAAELRLMLETIDLNSAQREAIFIAWKQLDPHCGVCKHHKEAKVFTGLKRLFVLSKCRNQDSYYENKYTRYDIVCDQFEMDERNFEEWLKEVNEHEQMLDLSEEKKTKFKRYPTPKRFTER